MSGFDPHPSDSNHRLVTSGIIIAGRGHSSVLLPLAVMHSQQPGLEIEAMNPKLEVLREAQSVSVAERSD